MKRTKVSVIIKCMAVITACGLTLAACHRAGAASSSAADTEVMMEETTGTQVSAEEEITNTQASVEEEITSTQASAEAETAEDGTDQAVDRYADLLDTTQYDGKLAIYFLDLTVGEEVEDKAGDCALLISPEGETMLIDTGNPACSYMVVEFLQDLGITRIDYLVLSHPHIDHIGGVPDIVENFEVGVCYRTNVYYTTQTYENCVNALESAGIETVYLHEGDSFYFGSVLVEIYNPPEEVTYPDDFPNNSTQFLNDTSLLMKLTYGESTFLFGGDLYLAKEKELVEKYGDLLDVDVAKVNHHGKDTSNCLTWVKTVTPLIAVGMGDENLGAMSIYERYVKYGATYYYTSDYDGKILLIADDQANYTVITQYDSWLRD